MGQCQDCGHKHRHIYDYCRHCKARRRHEGKLARISVMKLERSARARGWKVEQLGGAVWCFDRLGNPLAVDHDHAKALRMAYGAVVFDIAPACFEELPPCPGASQEDER